MKALAINSWVLLLCAQLNVVSKILFFSLNLQWCMTICRVHLSTDLLFSKFHLHGLMAIKIINTVESPVHPNNSWETRWAVQSLSKENKYKHWSVFCCFSFSLLCFNSGSIQGPDFLLIKSLAPFIVKSFSTLQRASGDTVGGWGKQSLCSSPLVCTVGWRPWSDPLLPIQPQKMA